METNPFSFLSLLSPLPCLLFPFDAAREVWAPGERCKLPQGYGQSTAYRRILVHLEVKITHGVGYLASPMLQHLFIRFNECSMIFGNNMTTLTAYFYPPLIIWGGGGILRVLKLRDMSPPLASPVVAPLEAKRWITAFTSAVEIWVHPSRRYVQLLIADFSKTTANSSSSSSSVRWDSRVSMADNIAVRSKWATVSHRPSITVCRRLYDADNAMQSARLVAGWQQPDCTVRHVTYTDWLDSENSQMTSRSLSHGRRQ